MRDYRTLEVWKLAKALAVLSYQLTSGFPKEELYSLTSQIRRAATSIAANIAEGVGRESDPELLRFIRISLGSLNELETHFQIASELAFISAEQLETFESSSRDLGVRLRNFARRLQNGPDTRSE